MSAKTTDKPDGSSDGITTVISDALRGSYFFVSAAAAKEQHATQDNSRSGLEFDDGKRKRRKRRKKAKRTKRNHSGPPGEAAGETWNDGLATAEREPSHLSSSSIAGSPREPRRAVEVLEEGEEGPAAAAQLLIGVEETTSGAVEAAPNVPSDDYIENEAGSVGSGHSPVVPPFPSVGIKLGDAELQSPPPPSPPQQAEPPPTSEAAAVIAFPLPAVAVAAAPEGQQRHGESSSDDGPTKLPTNEEVEFEALNDTAAAVSQELPPHLKVLNFKFNEGVGGVAKTEEEQEEENLLVVLPVEPGSWEDADSDDSARPPLVLLASTAAPSTTTTTTEAAAPTTTAPPPPTPPTALLELATSTTPAPRSFPTTLDPIRTGMKIIQSSTLFVASPDPGKNHSLI